MRRAGAVALAGVAAAALAYWVIQREPPRPLRPPSPLSTPRHPSPAVSPRTLEAPLLYAVLSPFDGGLAAALPLRLSDAGCFDAQRGSHEPGALLAALSEGEFGSSGGDGDDFRLLTHGFTAPALDLDGFWDADACIGFVNAVARARGSPRRVLVRATGGTSVCVEIGDEADLLARVDAGSLVPGEASFPMNVALADAGR